MHSTPPCVIHLLQALYVCTPAVHKCTRVALHHLSFFSTKKKPSGVARPTAPAGYTPNEVLAFTTGHPSEAFHFPVASF